jgi:endonuclease III
VPRARSVLPVRPDAARVLDGLLRHYPEPDTELHHRNAFELLVATVLSAQSTDRRVNETTPALFARYPDATSLAAADPADIEPLIHATGFFRAKSKAIVGLARTLVAEHGGRVPASMDALTKLPGVGRKTANVVLGHALGVPGLPVDRHVLRVAGRIGLTQHETPQDVERDLCAAIDPTRWTTLSDALILHGRRICRPKPLCDRCAIVDLCRYPFKAPALAPLDLTAPPRSARRRASGGTSTSAPQRRTRARKARR